MRKPKDKGIYVLSCPDTGEIRYIGQTQDAVKRYAGHRAESGNGAKARWVAELKAQGKLPKMTMVIKTDDLDAEEIELISIYRAMGANLLNVTDGGKGVTWAVSENSVPWIGKSKVSPSRYFLMRWRAHSAHSQERYKQKSGAYRRYLKSLSVEDRFRAEIRLADQLLSAGHAPALKNWFYEVKDNAIRLLPEVRAELGGL